MINIKDKSKCCGCSACIQACPKQCITMHSDDEGFAYPKVDKRQCVECGLCEKVCPIINQYDEQEPLESYAAKNANHDIRMSSSSGGIFTQLAEKIIADGGVVFGARFDADWQVVHDYTETIEGLVSFRGSKYLQSVIGDSYRQALNFLKSGRMVLFSGTSCQIAGLHHFLRRRYENLYTVDIICHGVPSPRVWCDYLSTVRPEGVEGGKNTVSSSLNAMPSIEGIAFRDKLNGWKKYGFVVRFSTDQREVENSVSPSGKDLQSYCFYEPFPDNLFMKGFLANLYLRPSCYVCPAKAGRSRADITLGDFWGIESLHPQFDDDRGVSAVVINTKQGYSLYHTIHIEQIAVAVDDIVRGNPSLLRSAVIPKQRHIFWKKYKTLGIDAIDYTLRRIHPPLLPRIKFNIKRILRFVLGM